MKLYKRFVILVVIVAMLGPVAVIAQEDEPIRIGASLPLTGTFSIAGSKHEEGYQLCVDVVNEMGGVLGRPVELLVSDNRSDVEQAITQYERLINEENVDLIFGTFSSRLTFPASAVAAQNEMVFPIPAGGALRIYEQGFDNLFYWQQNAGEFIGASPIEGLTELVGEDSEDFPETVAVVHADDFFANAIADGLLGNEVFGPDGSLITDLAPGALEEAGIEVVFVEQWPAEGFNDWLNLANSIKDSEADMVMGLTASPDEVIQLTRAMQTVDFQPKFTYFSQGTQIEYLEGVGEAVNGVVVHSAWHPNADFEGVLLGETFRNSDFIAQYREEFDAEPDEDVAIPFSLCQGMIQAVEAVGSTNNAEIRDWLASRTADDPVTTIMGRFFWDERGLPIEREFLLLQWQDEELNLIFPTDEFPGVEDIIHPKPEW